MDKHRVRASKINDWTA